MPTEVFEDSLDLHIGLLRAVPPNRTSYPFPALEIYGDSEMRTFDVSILENEFLRVVIVPGLGGRILELLDKRTNTEILRRYSTLEPQSGGIRGAFLREGIQFRYGDEDRLNAMGRVAIAADYDGESDSARWIAENSSGSGLCFHLRASLVENSAALELEFRVLNRSLAPVRYNGQVAAHLGEGRAFENGYYAADRDCGLSFHADPGTLSGVTAQGGTAAVRRFSGEYFLMPRQVDSFTLTIVPFSGLNGHTASHREFSIAMDSETIRIQSASPRMSHRIALVNGAGNAFEAPIDLYPEQVLALPLEGIDSPPVSIALVDKASNFVADIDLVAKNAERDVETTQMPNCPPVSSLADLNRLTHRTEWRAWAHLLRARTLVKSKDQVAALAAYDQSLLYNGDDPLTWWEKSYVMSQSQQNSDDRPELLNAHFLAPLEPVLRAEQFLNLSSEMSKEPHPLVNSLAERPEELIEVACLLIEVGYLNQANRWIDEALRHRSLAMLHYLQAYLLLVGTRMEAEAARHVSLAAGFLGEPPFPYRSIEWTALEQLKQRFPADKALLATCQLQF